jgi:hypothetical protein
MKVLCFMTAMIISYPGLPAISASKHYIESGNLDGIEYRIASHSGGCRSEAEILHEVYLTARDELFNEYGIILPVQQRVTIACGADIFRDLTGLTALTAAVCIPERDEIVFQRASALKKKGILESIVRHELLHYAAALTRMRAGISAEKTRENFWIEESFCTAAAPGGSYNTVKGREILSRLGDEKKIKKYLDQFLRSGNEKERGDAYAAAFVYGSDLILKKGRMKAFRLAVGAVE